jgi:glycosyltransferase involved in cell wall biosynthesis
MQTSCLVNNYNYAPYLLEAVNSALAQTRPFDEIIVVDDGSTDSSRELLSTHYGHDPRVRIVTKANAGQLSCFNEGFRLCTGDIIFFLDADDVYESCYVEEALKAYHDERHFDFVFVSPRRFGKQTEEDWEQDVSRDYGYTTLLTLFFEKWIGAPTSCLSMRRALLSKILPLPYLEDWRTRADDCLVFGASLMGGRKYHLAKPLIGYRVHDANHFFGRQTSLVDTYQRKLALNRLFHLLLTRLGSDRRQLSELVDLEFRIPDEPTYERFRQYTKILRRSPLRFSQKRSLFRSMLRHLFSRHSSVHRELSPADGSTLSKAA